MWDRLPDQLAPSRFFRSGCNFCDRASGGNLLRRHVRGLDDFDTDAHPGSAASVMTCIDGDAMTRKGRAGPALAIAAAGSYIAGTLSVIGLMLLAPPLPGFALRFGPPEYFALLLLGLLALAYMSSGSTLKSLAMGALGLLLGHDGIDPMTGFFRFNYGLVEWAMGLELFRWPSGCSD